MTEPQLCPKTLRWAAQHIRKFSIPRLDLDIQTAQDGAFEFAAESMDNWADEAELAEAKRKADPGCTCSPSPGAGLCPSCEIDRPAAKVSRVRVRRVHRDDTAEEAAARFDASLAAALVASVEKHAETLRNIEPALTVDQDKVDEHYGRIAYEASVQHEERARTAVGLGSWPGTPWPRMGRAEQESWTAAAKAVCVEMAKAMKSVRGGP